MIKRPPPGGPYLHKADEWKVKVEHHNRVVITESNTFLIDYRNVLWGWNYQQVYYQSIISVDSLMITISKINLKFNYIPVHEATQLQMVYYLKMPFTLFCHSKLSCIQKKKKWSRHLTKSWPQPKWTASSVDGSLRSVQKKKGKRISENRPRKKQKKSELEEFDYVHTFAVSYQNTATKE